LRRTAHHMESIGKHRRPPPLLPGPRLSHALFSRSLRSNCYRGGPPLSVFIHMIQDLYYAFRSIARQPGLAIVTVLTLALGLGLNVGVFTVVDGILFARGWKRIPVLRSSFPRILVRSSDARNPMGDVGSRLPVSSGAVLTPLRIPPIPRGTRTFRLPSCLRPIGKSRPMDQHRPDWRTPQHWCQLRPGSLARAFYGLLLVMPPADGSDFPIDLN
jgi:hypothetical protein